MAGPRAKRINIPLRRVALVCSAMLFALLVNVTYIQAFGSRSLNADPRNQRALIARFDHPRGDISTYDGVVIAQSTRADGGPYLYQRVYPEGEVYAPATGHVSLYQETGIEQSEDAVLSGTDPKVKVRALVRDGAEAGADVRLTIVDRVQRTAYDALRATGLRGAAVALNPLTGAILAMASYPSYDPNAYTGFDAGELARAHERLRADPARPLLNRALAQNYAPGSSFKIVTAAAALNSGAYTPASQVDAPIQLPLPGTFGYLRNSGGVACGDGHPPLAYAFQASCHTAFANIGLDLGQDTLREAAEDFGFNADDLTVPLQVAESVYPKGIDRTQTAMSAIGQFDDRATPLMLAMMSAAVANRGTLMRPYLVEEARLPDGSLINRAGPAEYRSTMPAPIAADLTEMMVSVTQPGGFGAGAALPGLAVAAKTGAAESLPGTPGHAVITAFAPADAPEVAVGVVVENAGPGGEVAAPIARAVIRSALPQGAVPVD
ncbi:peptidoglycan D,D-transpeptidase FtsI family protein [Nonomuraea typhae]|uniref:peptidoglycan D,D-transpeptidase FtsI family protein n=1 Tax=Nonomuraea typhae TaxID=2603600 RepID=UPI0012FBDE7F|nr:penicillin-binding protein 2 [Nonomuraea typhae]